MTTWEKARAINALAEMSIALDMQGKWFINQPVMLREKDSSTLVSITGRGLSPDEAIEIHWDALTSIAQDARLVVAKYGINKHYRWNGFMWQEYPHPVKSSSN